MFAPNFVCKSDNVDFVEKDLLKESKFILLILLMLFDDEKKFAIKFFYLNNDFIFIFYII